MLVKIGAKVVSHGRYVTFQLAEVAVPRSLFQKILELIIGPRRRPAPSHFARAHGMEDGAAIGPNPGVDLIVGLNIVAGRDRRAEKRLEGVLFEKAANDLHTIAHADHIGVFGQIVRDHLWLFPRVGRMNVNPAPALRAQLITVD